MASSKDEAKAVAPTDVVSMDMDVDTFFVTDRLSITTQALSRAVKDRYEAYLAQLEEETKDVRCLVCFETRQLKVLVACGHSICGECFVKLKKGSSTAKCPSCKKESSTTVQNFALTSMIENKYPALFPMLQARDASAKGIKAFFAFLGDHWLVSPSAGDKGLLQLLESLWRARVMSRFGKHERDPADSDAIEPAAKRIATTEAVTVPVPVDASSSPAPAPVSEPHPVAPEEKMDVEPVLVSTTAVAFETLYPTLLRKYLRGTADKITIRNRLLQAPEFTSIILVEWTLLPMPLRAALQEALSRDRHETRRPCATKWVSTIEDYAARRYLPRNQEDHALRIMAFFVRAFERHRGVLSMSARQARRPHNINSDDFQVLLTYFFVGNLHPFRLARAEYDTFFRDFRRLYDVRVMTAHERYLNRQKERFDSAPDALKYLVLEQVLQDTLSTYVSDGIPLDEWSDYVEYLETWGTVPTPRQSAIISGRVYDGLCWALERVTNQPRAEMHKYFFELGQRTQEERISRYTPIGPAVLLDPESDSDSDSDEEAAPRAETVPEPASRVVPLPASAPRDHHPSRVMLYAYLDPVPDSHPIATAMRAVARTEESALGSATTTHSIAFRPMASIPAIPVAMSFEEEETTRVGPGSPYEVSVD